MMDHSNDGNWITVMSQTSSLRHSIIAIWPKRPVVDWYNSQCITFQFSTNCNSSGSSHNLSWINLSSRAGICLLYSSSFYPMWQKLEVKVSKMAPTSNVTHSALYIFLLMSDPDQKGWKSSRLLQTRRTWFFNVLSAFSRKKDFSGK